MKNERYITRRLPVFILALVMALAAVGCDSNDDEESDADRFVGTWELASITDDDGDQTATFQAIFTDVTVVFNDAGNYTMTFVPVAGSNTVLSGTYDVNESGKSVTLNVTFNEQTVPLALPYSFDGDDELTVSASAAILNPLLGTNLSGTVIITLERA